MKSDVFVKDPQKRPICPRESESGIQFKFPSRFRRKKYLSADTITVSKFNANFKTMPKGF